MKNFVFCLLAGCCLSTSICCSQIRNYNRNILTSKISRDQLSSCLGNITSWYQYPSYNNRAAWLKISDEIKNKHLVEGDLALSYRWDTISASLRSQFKAQGNRVNFEEKYLRRRKILGNLFLAEMISGKGKYLSAIVHGINLILEESQWNLPAHENTEVDIYVSETSILLARITFLLEEELESKQEGINKKIRNNIQNRFLIPALNKDFLWKGNNIHKKLNNWTPWIAANWIETCLLIESNKSLKVDAIYTAMTCLDKFLNQYPEDGGCDEGPGYWLRNGGSTFEALDILFRATNGKINCFGAPLVKRIAAYIYKVYISGSYFVNFGDSNARPSINIDILFRFGLRTGDSILVSFASYLAKYSHYNGYDGGLSGIFTYDKVLTYSPKPPFISETLLDDIQVYSSRSIPNSNRGFYVAAKGGNNGESHNHNDVGNFIIYYNGNPVIVDVGVEAYTKATFDKEARYEIWTMQSQYHSLPTINSFQQKEGSSFAAKGVSLEIGEGESVFKANIAGAYPHAAGVEFWNRTITLKKGSSIEVNEDYSLKFRNGNTYLSLVTPCKLLVDTSGIVEFQFIEKSKKVSVKMRYDNKTFNLETEKIQLTDTKLKKSWANNLTRIKLTVRNNKNVGMLRYSFTD